MYEGSSPAAATAHRPNNYQKRCQKEDCLHVERGTSKAQAARSFDVSLSSVRRYVEKANPGGESLAPKKSPGSLPKLDEKATNLLEDDLKERPFASLQDRCDYVEVVTGLS
jgi:transposase